MSTPSVYATTDSGKLGAQLDDDGMVHVWRANGAMLGLYKLERFGGTLTPQTLRNLFATR